MKRNLILILVFLSCWACVYASDISDELYLSGQPYIKYFKDKAILPGESYPTLGAPGLTRSFQLYLGGHGSAEENMINYGTISYDQSILARIMLAGGQTDILDTYVNYYHQTYDVNNALINSNNKYYDGSGQALNYGLYRAIRIYRRDIANWGGTWDWIVDTGATACLIIDSLQAYQDTSNYEYKDFAVFLADYILRLQDNDGGIRYGPMGMHHAQGADFYWNLKSTEQNERVLCAFNALYQVTADTQYNQAAGKIKTWLKDMYDKTVHLYYSAATFNGSSWVKTGFGYVATDVVAFAPLELMFNDSYFGSTQTQRDNEVDAMFGAMEERTAFLNGQGKPILFKFSVSQTGEYGSVEFSSQMALAYLKAAQLYNQRSLQEKAQEYLDKYHVLVASLEGFFLSPSDDPQSKVAPYASYLDGSVAGGVPTGTGYYTYNCQAALASAYFAFAKSGYIPSELGGGSGIPQLGSTINLTDVPYYQNTSPYYSTGAAASQMILNFIRQAAGANLLTQQEIYQYAREGNTLGPELTPQDIDRALGHFDPYDSLVSNWADSYDSSPTGNPYQGYNFSVDTYDPNSDADAINKYMRDICHWMSYTVTKEDWWRAGELVAAPNTPAVIPLYGSYNHWVTVKGFSASTNPCPEPHTNPFNTPDFTVYGFWIKDPLATGIGQDTYKTAAECQSTYFLPVSSSDIYNGKFLQIAEPPLTPSKAKVNFPKPIKNASNLKFAGIKSTNTTILLSADKNTAPISKYDWQEIVDKRLLSDSQAVDAFTDTKPAETLLVKNLQKDKSDYYLIPFKKNSTGKNKLVSAVIILDADNGYFKEASWTKEPEVFPNVDKKTAVSLVRKLIQNEFSKDIKQTRKYSFFKRMLAIRDTYCAYNKLLNYINGSNAELIWQEGELSSSPYKPYWKVNANGYLWYVTQNKKVVPVTDTYIIINEIKTNRAYFKR